MQIPLQITFRNMDPSKAVEANLRQKADELEHFVEPITSCRIIVEAPHKHQHKGNIYGVKIHITLPGGEIIVNRYPEQNHAHEDIYVAIRDAFDAARRQLEDYVRIRRNKVKVHEVEPHGRITRLFPQEDYGFIEMPDGREIYFHRNSILNGNFDKLEEGTSVRFSEEMGDDGPQASTVYIEGKHHVT